MLCDCMMHVQSVMALIHHVHRCFATPCIHLAFSQQTSSLSMCWKCLIDFAQKKLETVLLSPWVVPLSVTNTWSDVISFWNSPLQVIHAPWVIITKSVPHSDIFTHKHSQLPENLLTFWQCRIQHLICFQHVTSHGFHLFGCHLQTFLKATKCLTLKAPKIPIGNWLQAQC